jgi:hypothetical protein
LPVASNISLVQQIRPIILRAARAISISLAIESLPVSQPQRCNFSACPIDAASAGLHDVASLTYRAGSPKNVSMRLCGGICAD